MSQPDPFITRRRLLQALAAASVAAALPMYAQAQSPPPLSVEDPTAKALGYVEDSSQADAARFPAHKAGQDCIGCNFYQGQGKAARGPCSLFPGKSVAGKGWCSAFVAKG